MYAGLELMQNTLSFATRDFNSQLISIKRNYAFTSIQDYKVHGSI